jgi:predicted Zn-dependent protease
MRLRLCFMNCLLVILWAVWGALLAATVEPTGFEKSSLAWRTALHFDPGAEAPLRSLIRLYQQEKKIGELIGLYTQHLSHYPQDEGAKVVLARLYVTLADDRVVPLLAEALATHPQNALLLHTRALWLESQHDPLALEALATAVAAQRQTSRRDVWLRDLLQKSAQLEREDLAIQRLEAARATLTPLQSLGWSRRCLELGLHQAAAAVLVGGDFSKLQGDEAVEAWLVQARVALAKQQTTKAASCAGGALALLAPEHWRYGEVVALVWQCADAAGRKQMLEDSFQRWQSRKAHEPSALAYADLLIAAGKKHEAQAVVMESLQLLPDSSALEKRAIELLESQQPAEAMIDFLRHRLTLKPARTDLQERLSRGLLELGRVEEGLAALASLLSAQEPQVQIQTLLQTSRHLRARNLQAEAARVLEQALKSQPERWDLRKELAEIFITLQKPDQARLLFEPPVPESLSAQVRKEVALYLISRKWWPQAQMLLEAGLMKSGSAFDSRLLLARVMTVIGDQAAAAQHLGLCRESCDTAARYAAWLALAWERALELGDADALAASEFLKLQPAKGVAWNDISLAKLFTLAETTTQSTLHEAAEKQLRVMLADAALPQVTRAELQQLLIAVLQQQPSRLKVLEEELQSALDGADAELAAETRLRLLLLYHQSQRLDLVGPLLRQIDPSACDEAALLQQAMVIARQYDETEIAITLAERLVRLQPEERDHWVAWTSLLQQTGDESRLRASLQYLRSRAADLGLSSRVQEILRAHLAASAWRSLSIMLSHPEDSVEDAKRCLEELDALEKTKTHRLWLAWARGLVALRAGDETARADAVQALQSAEPWVQLPDGLNLSLSEAQRLLEKPVSPSPQSMPDAASTYARLPQWTWVFQPKGQTDLQRWCLTPDGTKMLVQDSAARLYAVDRASGRLLWDKRLNVAAQKTAPSSASYGSEQISYPAEWCVSDQHVCCLKEDMLSCQRVQDGALVWQVPLRQALPGTQGTLAYSEGRVLWWRAAFGRLDALDEISGKLLWSTSIPALSREPESTLGSPVWLTSGISVDAGRVLVWGQGSALLQLADGALLARASVGTEHLAFPLDLKGLSLPPASANKPIILGLGSRNTGSINGGSRILPANYLAMPSYGYPGMYGSSSSSPWLLWGGDGARLLHGDGIWLLGQNIPSAQYSILGIPRLHTTTAPRAPLNSALPIGTVGQSLIVALETGVLKVSADGAVRRLSTAGFRENSPSQHSLPAVALDGTQLGMATRDELSITDALTGAVIWRSAWPSEASTSVQTARESLSPWQSLRWSSRGLMLHEASGRSLVIEWQALMARGDFIVPVGSRCLMNFRCR